MTPQTFAAGWVLCAIFAGLAIGFFILWRHSDAGWDESIRARDNHLDEWSEKNKQLEDEARGQRELLESLAKQLWPYSGQDDRRE